jgi:hypothetical protein
MRVGTKIGMKIRTRATPEWILCVRATQPNSGEAGFIEPGEGFDNASLPAMRHVLVKACMFFVRHKKILLNHVFKF